jgi:hypothetical protein
MVIGFHHVGAATGGDGGIGARDDRGTGAGGDDVAVVAGHQRVRADRDGVGAAPPNTAV